MKNHQFNEVVAILLFIAAGVHNGAWSAAFTCLGFLGAAIALAQAVRERHPADALRLRQFSGRAFGGLFLFLFVCACTIAVEVARVRLG